MTASAEIVAPYPGVLDATHDGASAVLSWGPSAGVLRWQALSEWKRAVWMVMSEDLTPARCRRFTLRHPVRVVARRYPIVRAAVKAAPALCVDEELARALIADGCRVCRVGYHRTCDEVRAETYGPGWANVRVLASRAS